MFGRYRLDRLIREGGTTEVYEASVLGAEGFVRRVALKRLKPQVTQDATLVRAFEAEARMLSRVHHPNVVAVIDFGSTDGQPYQVLEHVDGLDLVRLEARARASRVTAAPSLWVAIVAEAAHGLEHVHKIEDEAGRPLGIVHRDVTPTNVFVAWSGDVKLGDFSVAFSQGERDATLAGVIKGDLAYQAPEQLRGDVIDGRADVFSLGCLLHRMLVGSSPQDDPETRRQVTLGVPLPIDPSIAPDLAQLIAHAIAPDAGERMASAAVFAEACARWLGSQGILDGRAIVREAMAALSRALQASAAPYGLIASLANVGALLGDDRGSSQLATSPPAPTQPQKMDFTEILPPERAEPETRVLTPETREPETRVLALETGEPATRVEPRERAYTDITDKSAEEHEATRHDPIPSAALLEALGPAAALLEPPGPTVRAPEVHSSSRGPTAGNDGPTETARAVPQPPPMTTVRAAAAATPLPKPPAPMPPAPPRPLTDSPYADDEELPQVAPDGYTLLQPIARGGFAQVFRASHADFEEHLAVKVLRRDKQSNPVSMARFDREVAALAKLDSPHLVRLRDSGRLADGRPWLAMDLLKGRTLAHEIVASRGAMHPHRVRRLARDIALGLSALHQADLVHRDLGARNVMVVDTGGSEKAMIIDLGHARWTDARSRSTLTEPGLVLGNARWMAPEQIYTPSKVGPAADLYSLGLLMLAMVTGRAPFVGSPASLLEQQLEDLPDIPPGPFSALIRRLTEKDPARRWANAAAVAAELNQIVVPVLRGSEVGAAVALPPPPPAKSGVKQEDRTMPMIANATMPLEPSPVRKGLSPVMIGAGIVALIAGIMLVVLMVK